MIPVWDTPGLQENRGAYFEIIGCYRIVRLFETNKGPLRILIAVEHNELEAAKFTVFIKRMDMIGNMFNDLRDFSKSFCLIVTKVDKMHKTG